MTELSTSYTASSIAAADANCRTGRFTTSQDWESPMVNVRSVRSLNPCCSCPARPFELRLRRIQLWLLNCLSCCTVTKCLATGRVCHECVSYLRYSPGCRVL